MSQSVSSRVAKSQTAPSQTASRPSQSASAPATSVTAVTLSESERAVLEALRGIRYGEVEVIVHGSRIVQITRSQKLRVDGR